MDVMKTLFLNPPSYDDFDGGAGSRYQATREVWSFWYPTWLAYPAGMIPGARLLDAPPHNYTVEMTVNEAKNYDLVVIHTSTPSIRMETLKLSRAIDVAARKKFDYSMLEVAEGRDWSTIGGISWQKNGGLHHNPDRPRLSDAGLDKLPVVDEGYE